MKTKRDKRALRNKAVKKERGNRNRALLVQLGLWDVIAHPEVKDQLQRAYYPPIELSVSEQLATNESVEAVLRELRQAMENATFDCPLLGDNYSIIEYCSHVLPIVDMLKTVRSFERFNVEPALVRKLDGLDPLTSLTTYEAAFEALLRKLVPILVKHSRVDEYLYSLDWKRNWTTHDRLQQQLTLLQVQPEVRFVTKDGERRRVYRCGLAKTGGAKWTEWRSSTLGLKGEDRVYPVFVQRHVLERLKERGGYVFGKGFEGELHFDLAWSLSHPKIHANLRNDGAFLVEYHLNKYKIGYFVVRKLDDLILVETFLFLTMDGTPEGNQLNKQFGLDRTGKEYIGLDDLWTFLGTDLALDPELVEHLGKCGCGHLFEMRKYIRFYDFHDGYAADIRKYLCLEDWQPPSLPIEL